VQKLSGAQRNGFLLANVLHTAKNRFAQFPHSAAGKEYKNRAERNGFLPAHTAKNRFALFSHSFTNIIGVAKNRFA